MTSGNRLPAALLAAVVTVGLAACGDADAQSPAPGSVAGEGPARPAAGGGDLVVETRRLEVPIVLDPVPEGLVFGELWHDQPPSDGGPARATLYGDPDLADTLDGPVLLVGSSSGGDSEGIAGPPPGVPGEREIDLRGRTARVVPDTDRTWVLIEGRDSVEFVVGRGVDQDDLIAAAREADFGAATKRLAPDAVPAGLEPLVAGDPQDGPGRGSGEHMLLVGESSWIRVHAVRADPRLAALWGFWVDDATGTVVRGRPGSAGDLRGAAEGGPRAPARVWAEDGWVLAAVLVVDEAGDGEALLDRVVGDLRVGTWAELQDARDQGVERPPTRGEAACGPDGGFVSGVEEGIRWSFQVRVGPWDWSACYLDLTSGVGGGGSMIPPPIGELAVGGGGSGIVGGVAPPGTSRVTVTTAGGATLEARLSDTGPRPGERVWGAVVLEGLMDPVRPPFTVTAYDAAGAVLATKVG